jgi:hypothetical protein
MYENRPVPQYIETMTYIDSLSNDRPLPSTIISIATTMRPLPAILLALPSALVLAQSKCHHYLDSECVDAFGSTTFNFKPLFSSSPRFAYGFRVYFDNEVDRSLIDRPLGYTGDMNEAKMWLEYANDTLHIDTSTNMTTSFATLLTNATGSVLGGSNGCEGLLGAACLAYLKDVLKWAVVMSEMGAQPFETNVEKFQTTPWKTLSCPNSIFDNYRGLEVEGMLTLFLT